MSSQLHLPWIALVSLSRTCSCCRWSWGNTNRPSLPNQHWVRALPTTSQDILPHDHAFWRNIRINVSLSCNITLFIFIQKFKVNKAMANLSLGVDPAGAIPLLCLIKHLFKVRCAHSIMPWPWGFYGNLCTRQMPILLQKETKEAEEAGPLSVFSSLGCPQAPQASKQCAMTRRAFSPVCKEAK